ncbi:MAG: septum formation initiator family protein [Clostridia bacterium]|nr:septum formation initiator family protein [Clostridia bacterium]
MKISKLLKKFFIVGVIIYISVTFINQQKSINAYNSQQEILRNKIKEQEEYKQTLLATKENISSPEYIEELAREKLDMYLPNEKVYIDVNK